MPSSKGIFRNGSKRKVSWPKSIFFANFMTTFRFRNGMMEQKIKFLIKNVEFAFKVYFVQKGLKL